MSKRKGCPLCAAKRRAEYWAKREEESRKVLEKYGIKYLGIGARFDDLENRVDVRARGEAWKETGLFSPPTATNLGCYDFTPATIKNIPEKDFAKIIRFGEVSAKRVQEAEITKEIDRKWRKDYRKQRKRWFEIEERQEREKEERAEKRKLREKLRLEKEARRKAKKQKQTREQRRVLAEKGYSTALRIIEMDKKRSSTDKQREEK